MPSPEPSATLVKSVFDTSVVLAGIGWRVEAHQCLVMMACRRILAYATDATIKEARTKPQELPQGGHFPDHHRPVLDWYLAPVRRVTAAEFGKQQSRDRKDDSILACAFGAGAKVVTAYDKDLLDLGKRFGIEIIGPSEWLRRFRI